MEKIDLHIHTNFSDGDLSPEQLVDIAVKRGLKAIAITDHDTAEGISRAINHADGRIEVIPGIEITCNEKSRGFFNVHVIGLFINQKNKEIGKLRYNPKRRSDNRGQDTIGISEAINIIKMGGGLSFLAHPGVYGRGNSIELIGLFLKMGGDGIETMYPYDKVFPDNYDKKRTNETIKFFIKIAEGKNILQTGGSDFHGRIRDIKIGDMDIGFYMLKEIKKKLKAT